MGKNIVWLASYPKSGNTWFRMFLANYLSKSDQPLSLKEINSTSIAGSARDFDDILGMDHTEMFDQEVKLYFPQLFINISEELAPGVTLYKKTHDAYTLNEENKPIFPEEISLGAIYFIRNPLDVAVSYANHASAESDYVVKFINDEFAKLSNGKGDQLIQTILSWKSHVASWTLQNKIPVLVIRYEDMLLNPAATFRSILEFIHIKVEEAQLLKAIENSSFTTLQKLENESGFVERFSRCKQFFWKGSIGNFRNCLTSEQIQKIIAYNYDTMKTYRYIDKNGNLTI